MIIAIDNGVKTGALCAITDYGAILATAKIPYITFPEREGKIGKSEVDVPMLMLWLYETTGENYHDAKYVIEEPKGSQSATACASMFGCFHAIRGAFDAKHLEWSRMFPAEWQRVMLPTPLHKKETTKERAERCAKELQPIFEFPKLRPKGKKLHDGIIDAYLIAEYFRAFKVEGGAA